MTNTNPFARTLVAEYERRARELGFTDSDLYDGLAYEIDLNPTHVAVLQVEAPDTAEVRVVVLEWPPYVSGDVTDPAVVSERSFSGDLVEEVERALREARDHVDLGG